MLCITQLPMHSVCGRVPHRERPKWLANQCETVQQKAETAICCAHHSLGVCPEVCLHNGTEKVVCMHEALPACRSPMACSGPSSGPMSTAAPPGTAISRRAEAQMVCKSLRGEHKWLSGRVLRGSCRPGQRLHLLRGTSQPHKNPRPLFNQNADGSTSPNDFALLKLDRPVPSIRPVPLLPALPTKPETFTLVCCPH